MNPKKSNSIQNTRTCLMIDDDVDIMLRRYQAQIIQKNNISCSYSKAINHALQNSLEREI
jgi:hypothetical protein